MKSHISRLFLALAVIALVSLGSADEVSYGVDSSIAHAEGNVEFVYGAVKVPCREANVNQERRDHSAEGDVVVTIKDRGTWSAPAVRGNLEAKTVDFGTFRLDTDVWHTGGEGGGWGHQGTVFRGIPQAGIPSAV